MQPEILPKLRYSTGEVWSPNRHLTMKLAGGFCTQHLTLEWFYCFTSQGNKNNPPPHTPSVLSSKIKWTDNYYHRVDLELVTTSQGRGQLRILRQRQPGASDTGMRTWWIHTADLRNGTGSQVLCTYRSTAGMGERHPVHIKDCLENYKRRKLYL